ncbi:MAG: 30S ribosomal protein S4e [Nanoarchaeota archaeon]|nr:30S ribosomal protein S4e [Nanoarchaeota archaeon]MBU1622643.1 30S ribosomal protein S4e [Nanoarchaeota archaeon]MBU1974271.1 30S ribosomal protein S4e [Nanoarchaeota archaeon]
MKQHLKRIAVPKTWAIDRKANKFIVRPKPGAHSFERGLALGVIIRDILGLATTMSEVKKLLNNNDVLVDGKRRKNHRHLVGLFDILAFPKVELYYRLELDQKGRLVLTEIEKTEASFKICQVTGKTVLTKNKVQYNLHDGKNILAEVKAKVGDSLVLGLPKLEVKEVLALKLGMSIFLTKGKHIGDVGTLKEIKGKEAKYTKQGKEIETSKAYLFVIGDKEPLINIGMNKK